MVKMLEFSEIVVRDVVKKSEDAAALLYLISERCMAARAKCYKNPDEVFHLLEEISHTLGFVSESLEDQAGWFAERLIDETAPKAA